MFFGRITNSLSVAFIYFSDITRFASFFIGALIATVIKKYKFRKFKILPVLTIGLSMLLVLSYFLTYDGMATYLFGFLLTDLITAVLILAFFTNDKIKEPKIISKLSEWSYAIYLFHWPALIVTTELLPKPYNYIATILITAVLIFINQTIWEPLFRGKDIKIGKLLINQSKLPVIAMSSLTLVFLLTFTLNSRAPEMISLQKEIWHQSVQQDVDKIVADIDTLKPKLKTTIALDDDTEGKTVAKADWNGGNKTVTIIGDSVLLGPRKYLANSIKNAFVDAEGYRLLDNGDTVIKQLVDNKKLGDYVVVALGANAINEPKDSLDKIINAIPKGHKLILVTPFDKRHLDRPAPKVMRDLAKKHDYITIMDWHSYASSHLKLYDGTDGVHFYGYTKTYKAYSDELVKTLKKAVKTPSKK